jgi:hypothetical protein
LSQPRLLITYEPRETDPFGMLRIEYFVCETFSIEFDFSFFMRTSGSDFIVRYSNEMDVSGALFDGVIFINRRLNNKETRVPAFDCSERNQCRGSAYQPLCEGPAPELQILTQPLSNGLLLTGIVNNMDVDEISAWIWDVSAGQSEEPFHQDNPLLLSPERLRGPVTLTAITRKGCFGIKQR